MEINSYNFVSQNVFLSESCAKQCVHVCDNDKLMIVHEHHKQIKIYDLTEENQTLNNVLPVMTVPVMESGITQLIHSHFANYLAILAHNHSGVKMVCVYSNYWIERQAIRRQFGVLANSEHSTHAHNTTIRDNLSLEVIEFNDALISRDCQSIGCCESSANLCICCGFRVNIYNYQRCECNYNIYRIDFVHVITVELQWFATSVAILENYLTVSSKTHVSLLKIIFDYDDNSSGDTFSKTRSDNNLKIVNKCVEWDFDDNNCSIRLPSMFGITDRSIIENNLNHAEEVIGPASQQICCKFGLNVNHMSSSICRASLQILLCRYFFANNSVVDIQLIGYYESTDTTKTDPLNASKLREIGSNKSVYPFLSQSSNDLIDGALVVLTKQNTYCYSIVNRIEMRQQINFGNNTGDASVRSICVNKFDDTLHALTNNGLSTYSFNFIPLLLDDNKLAVSSSLKLNTRLFLNIDYLLSTKNYLLLVSLLDNDKRTIYSLRKPSLQHIYDDAIEILLSGDCDLNAKSKLNLLTYLYSVLHFNFSKNLNIDHHAIQCYQNCCAILCNTRLAEINTGNNRSFEFELRIINEAKLNFSQLISLKFNHKIIFEFIRKNVINNNKLLITDEISFNDFEKVLISLYDYDRVLFCQFALNQSCDYKAKQTILGLLRNDQSILSRIVVSKILFNDCETDDARNILISIDGDLIKLFCQNYCFILNDTSFALFIENCVNDAYYEFLILLAKQKSSVKFVLDLISEQNLMIRQKFLCLAFRNFPNLFDPGLYYELISINIHCLSDASLVASLKSNDQIDFYPLWFEQLPPCHRQNDCDCIQCNAMIAQLFLLLYIIRNESIIKEKVYNLLNTIETRFEWLFTAKLLSMRCIDASVLLLKDYPNTVLSFIKDICNSNDLIQVFDLLNTQSSEDIESTTAVLLNYTLNQLTELLTPTQLIQLLPDSWKDFASPFVEKSIINLQSKLLKEKIINLGAEVKSSMIYE